METRKWTNPISGETEDVEVGSAREKELMDKLEECGLYAGDDPEILKHCISMDEYIENKKNGMYDNNRTKLD